MKTIYISCASQIKVKSGQNQWEVAEDEDAKEETSKLNQSLREDSNDKENDTHVQLTEEPNDPA